MATAINDINTLIHSKYVAIMSEIKSSNDYFIAVIVAVYADYFERNIKALAH